MNIKLKDTPAERDYKGCGWSVLVVRDDTPAAIIYLPDLSGASFKEVVSRVDFSAITWAEGAQSMTKAYVGMTSCYEFCAYMELGADDYRKVVYEDKDIEILKIVDDLFVTGYKGGQKYAVSLNKNGLKGVSQWKLNYKPDADVWRRYTYDFNIAPRGKAYLLDDDGEDAHILDGVGDGTFFEKEEPWTHWRMAYLEAYDDNNEIIGAYALGFIEERDAL